MDTRQNTSAGAALPAEELTERQKHFAELRQALGPILDHRISERHTLGDLYQQLWTLKRGHVHTGYNMPFVDAMFERGQLFGPTDHLQLGRPRECHRNSLLLWHASGGALRLTTGFAYCEDTDMWVHHTWLLNSGGRTLETTVRRDLYWGAVLTDQEAHCWIADYLKPPSGAS